MIDRAETSFLSRTSDALTMAVDGQRFADVAALLAGIPVTWSLWSKAKSEGRWNTDVLLVDTLGDLKDLYGAGDIAFVGGSLTPISR